LQKKDLATAAGNRHREKLVKSRRVILEMGTGQTDRHSNADHNTPDHY